MGFRTASAASFLRVIVATGAALLCHRAAEAAPITWGPPFDVRTADDIDTRGLLVGANNITGDQLSPVVRVGGEDIRFQAMQVGAAITPTLGHFSDFGGDTGSDALNAVFDSYAWMSATVPWSFELGGLVADVEYQIQILAGGDRRAITSLRNQRVGDGEMLENLSGDLSRGGPGSVVGRFIAGGVTQVIRMHAGETNGFDPAISGFVLRRIPPPTAPSDIVLSHGEVAPATGEGTLLGFLSASDVNDGDRHLFSLVGPPGSPGHDLFSIRCGDQLWSAAELGSAGAAYLLRVRATDSSSLTYEETLVLRVTEFGPIRSIRMVPGGVRLSIAERQGRQIGVEYSRDLQPGGWVGLGNFFPAVDGVGEFLDPDELRRARQGGYYRAILRPLLP